MRASLSIALLGLALSVVPAAFAQQSPGSSQVQQAEQQQAIEAPRRIQKYVVIPKLSPDDQEEFGQQVVLSAKPSKPIFTGYTDNQLMWTSNALLTQSNEVGDMLFISTTGFGIEPPLPEGCENLILNFYGRFQAYRYDIQDQINFHVYTGGANVGYKFDEDWVVLIGNNYNIFYDEPVYNDFYQETDHNINATRNFAIADDLFAYAGTQIQYRNSSPARFARVEYDLFGGVRYALDPQWVAQIYERAEFQDYTADDTRRDWNLLTVLSLSYYFNDWCNVRVFGNYTYNSSNRLANSYENVNLGGGATLLIQF